MTLGYRSESGQRAALAPDVRVFIEGHLRNLARFGRLHELARSRDALVKVHPRPCGEHVAPEPAGIPFNGFIPARAGNTAILPSRSSLTPVHPRPCGEHMVALRGARAPAGSSPPVREHVPAARRCRATTVHPRPCGEHGRQCIQAGKECGSSPPVRGTRGQASARIPSQRFIPARAGNTVDGSCITMVATVHPRPCGEHCARTAYATILDGSSPPVRGTLFLQKTEN